MARPSQTPENYVIFAAITWVAVSFIEMILADAGVYGAKTIVEAVALLALVSLFPNEPRRSWSIGLIGSSLGIATVFLAAWLVFYALPYTADFTFPATQNLNGFDVAAGYVATAVVSPLFEEKLARHLALRGSQGIMPPQVSRYVPPSVVAALIVSVIFAWAHPELMGLAFLFSLVLCWLALKYDFNFVQRAFLHGAYNGAVMTWYLTFGYGVYS